jgi:hypothetical protein
LLISEKKAKQIINSKPFGAFKKKGQIENSSREGTST